MTILEERINPFIESIERSVKTENWYAVLTMSLALPDICGRLENPKLNSSQRYVKFFDTYLKSFYVLKVGNQEKFEFLSGPDFYALRCSFLHEGSTGIEHQRARKVLDSYIFVNGSKFLSMHRNMFSTKEEKKLQLQVDQFAEEIVEAVRQWVRNNHSKIDVLERAESMIRILDLSKGISL